MPTNNYTIAIRDNGQLYRITKILFGRDGSYMVMVPYHAANQGILFKLPVTYTPTLDEPSLVPYSSVIDAGDVDEKRVKLSHHRSGLLQFSGEGVMSGFDQSGKPRGIGIQSWSLDNPAPGPSFGISLQGLQDFKLATAGETKKVASDWIVFDTDELPPVAGNGFVLEGFYFPPKGRRFLKQTKSGPITQIVHPIGFVMDLKVALADPAGCDFPGFIGLHAYSIETDQGSGYIISSSTGNIRQDEKGNFIGDGLYCVFPDDMKSLARRRLDYIPTSVLSDDSNPPPQ